MPDPTLQSRLVSLRLLQAVLEKRRPLDESLATEPSFLALGSRDRAFVRNLVATTLRRLGEIDALLGEFLERPPPRKAKAVTSILRLGACQRLFLRTPSHAAVDTSVRLVREAKLHGFAKLVNAVMRRIDREGEAVLAGQDAPRIDTPDWLWESWVRAYGEDTARRIAEAHLAEAPLDITPKDSRTAADVARQLGAEILPTGALRCTTGGAVTDLPGFTEGIWWVQDAAAALPARLLGDISGRSVIDLCAAPGGKTAQLAAAGARVTAVERSERRLARLSENMARLGLEAEKIAADAATWRPTEPADAVLLDAPCSATGTIRRHPDVAHLKGPEDVVKLAQAQDRLLAAAVDMVRPGGTIVFCTCSLQPEEGADRLAALLAGGAPVTFDPISPEEVGGLAELVTPQGTLRTLPYHLAESGGIDGFFAARLKRRT